MLDRSQVLVLQVPLEAEEEGFRSLSDWDHSQPAPSLSAAAPSVVHPSPEGAHGPKTDEGHLARFEHAYDNK